MTPYHMHIASILITAANWHSYLTQYFTQQILIDLATQATQVYTEAQN